MFDSTEPLDKRGALKLAMRDREDWIERGDDHELPELRACEWCDAEFRSKIANKKTCSAECARELRDWRISAAAGVCEALVAVARGRRKRATQRQRVDGAKAFAWLFRRARQLVRERDTVAGRPTFEPRGKM